jgi:sortase A
LNLSRQQTYIRRLGGLLIAAGIVCVGVFAVPTVYGAAMARVEVAAFRAESASHKDWDSARILAYRRSLRVKFPPAEAVLRIQRLGLEAPVLEGVDDLTMNRGLGHIPGTARPGEAGNVGVAGHRDGFFRSLKDVVVGDAVDVERPDGSVDRYRVERMDVVRPNDTSALRATVGPELTLVTCYPFKFVGAAPERYVVRASLVSHWKQRIALDKNSSSGD